MARRKGKSTGTGTGTSDSVRAPDTIDVYDATATATATQASGKPKGKGKGKAAQRALPRLSPTTSDDDQDQDDDEHIPRGPAVFDSDDELNGSIEGEDEEIDSDEAFDSQDEERFDGFRFASDPRRRPQDGSDDEDEDEDEDENEDEDDGAVDLSRMLDSADEDDAADRLASHISSFAKRARSPSPTAGTDAGSKRTRRVLAEEAPALAEGEFATGSGSGLGLADFLAPLSGDVDFASIRKSSKALGKRAGGKALSAPLPQLAQDRLDRAAAYTLSKSEAQGWEDSQRRIKDAAQLSFPLQSVPTERPSTAGLVAAFKPDTQLERSVADLLQAGGMTESQLSQQEDLALNHLDPAEAKQRRAHLRRMRELMFRAEQKAKRVSKIKSKAYRKVHRKERERAAELGAKHGSDSDSDAEAEAEADERMEAERRRAEERATLRHTSRAGKWARGVLANRTDGHSEALDDHLRRADELRARIHAHAESESESDSDSDEGAGDAKRRAFDELARLEKRRDAGDKGAEMKGVYAMKFMQDAQARREQEVQRDVDDFRAEMDRLLPAEEGEEPVHEGAVRGRATYGAASGSGSAPAPAPAPVPVTVPQASGKRETRAAEESNPWLATESGSGSGQLSSKKNAVLVGRGVSASAKAAARTARHKRVGGWEVDDSALALDPAARLEPDEPGAATRLRREQVAAAFAHDDVVSSFRAEKAAAEHVPPSDDETHTLPGWGSWGGKGAKLSGAQRRKKRQPHKPNEGPAPGPGANVIVSAKKDAKAARFTVHDLPHPYTSVAQYNMAMRNPLGPEWNTRIETERLTAPRVTKKLGKVIAPIGKSTVSHSHLL